MAYHKNIAEATNISRG